MKGPLFSAARNGVILADIVRVGGGDGEFSEGNDLVNP